MPNSPARLRSMRPSSVLNWPNRPSPGATLPAVSARSLAKAALPCAGIEGLAPQLDAKRAVAVHRAHVEEDVDRQQVLGPRAAGSSRRCARARWPASRAIAGSSPSRRPCSTARRPRAGCRRCGRRAARTSRPPRRPARRRRTPARCPGPWRAGSRRGRPSPAPRPHRGTADRHGRLAHARLARSPRPGGSARRARAR